MSATVATMPVAGLGPPPNASLTCSAKKDHGMADSFGDLLTTAGSPSGLSTQSAPAVGGGEKRMTSGGAQGGTAEARLVWAVTPLEGVGPLRFGMSMAEAAVALPEIRELRRFQAVSRHRGHPIGAQPGETCRIRVLRQIRSTVLRGG